MLSVQPTASGNDLERGRSAEYRGCIDVVPFEAWHLDFLRLRPEQQQIGVDVTPEYAQALQNAGEGFSGWVGSQVVAAAGIIKFWSGRAQVWGMFSDLMPVYGALVHRHVLRYIQRSPVARIECVIDPAFPVSVDWAIRLGFRYESRMEKYGVHGQDMLMYVRIR